MSFVRTVDTLSLQIFLIDNYITFSLFVISKSYFA